MFPNDQPSPSPSASLEVDGDLRATRIGFVIALLFFFALSAVAKLDKRLPLADAALVDAALVDAAVLAVADATARRSYLVVDCPRPRRHRKKIHQPLHLPHSPHPLTPNPAHWNPPR